MEKIFSKPVCIRSILFFTLTLTVLSFLVGKGFLLRFPVDMSMLVFHMNLINYSKRVRLLSVSFISGAILFYISCLAGFPSSLSCLDSFDMIHIVFAMAQIVSVKIALEISYLTDKHVVAKIVDIWDNLKLRTNVLYSTILMIVLFIIFCCSYTDHKILIVVKYVLLSLLSIYEIFLIIRWHKGTLFLYSPKTENAMMQSMQKSLKNSEINNEELYKDIYNRVLLHFKTNKPYLNDALTMNDVAREVYTNKVYLSRAVNMMTGKNFCQFVNKWRIDYALELFYRNPDLKISDMSVQCGFHNNVSFSMAFHMFMEMTPSEWCHMERSKLSKRKK